MTNEIKKSSAFLSERKKIIALYVLFFGTVFLSFVIPPAASTLALMACVLMLAAIYSLRAQASEDSAIYSHCSFLIRTFWRVNLYFFYALILGLAFLLVFTDYSALKPCVFFIADHWTSMAMNWGAKQYHHLFSECARTFYKANFINTIAVGVIILTPPVGYLLYRFYLGWRCAVRGIKVKI